mmetsp:Transcript_68946/g.213225  ORF Transcript_68946/g.213225 Transcript_68946/m.213225 type:complete len:237 (+) Transcript_68946:186-896(+)
MAGRELRIRQAGLAAAHRRLLGGAALRRPAAPPGGSGARPPRRPVHMPGRCLSWWPPRVPPGHPLSARGPVQSGRARHVLPRAGPVRCGARHRQVALPAAAPRAPLPPELHHLVLRAVRFARPPGALGGGGPIAALRPANGRPGGSSGGGFPGRSPAADLDRPRHVRLRRAPRAQSAVDSCAQGKGPGPHAAPALAGALCQAHLRDHGVLHGGGRSRRGRRVARGRRRQASVLRGA